MLKDLARTPGRQEVKEPRPFASRHWPAEAAPACQPQELRHEDRRQGDSPPGPRGPPRAEICGQAPRPPAVSALVAQDGPAFHRRSSRFRTEKGTRGRERLPPPTSLSADRPETEGPCLPREHRRALACCWRYRRPCTPGVAPRRRQRDPRSPVFAAAEFAHLRLKHPSQLWCRPLVESWGEKRPRGRIPRGRNRRRQQGHAARRSPPRGPCPGRRSGTSLREAEHVQSRLLGNQRKRRP